VHIQGTVQAITDPDAVYEVGLAIGHVMGNAVAGAAQGAAGAAAASGDAVNDYVAAAARKRYAYVVDPVRVISWDHAKLTGS
jgi:hypothetical protein